MADGDRFSVDTFVIGNHLVIAGSRRAWWHPAVTGNPGAFTTAPLAVPQISPRLAAYLAVYPDGPEL